VLSSALAVHTISDRACGRCARPENRASQPWPKEAVMDLALLVLRGVIGVLFVAHGSQKLFGAFGGGGVKGTADMFDAISLRPGRLHAPAAGATELVGGTLLALGLLTPVGAALVIAVMVAAVVAVHLPRGIWNTNGGYEYNLVMIAGAVALAGVGPGAWSLDGALDFDLSATGWALAALGVGLVGGLGTVIAGRMTTARDDRGTQAHPA
jgi:putative oxidoreductase